jgi:hypothetical protein
LRQRLICVDSSAPAAPALGRPVAPVGAGAAGAEKSQGSAALSFSMLLSWSARRARAALTLRAPASWSSKPTRSSSPAQLVHLRAQLLGALGGLRGLRDLALELGDASVALGERRLVVLVRLSDDVAAVICVACCCAAWSPRACGSPATCACVAAPSFPSPMRGPAFLLGRAKKMPASFPIRASSRLVTNRCMTKARTFKPILLFPWELILLFAV